MAGMITDHVRPSTQVRNVNTGIDGSSVLATAERTSGYGESSSNSAVWFGSRFGSSKSDVKCYR